MFVYFYRYIIYPVYIFIIHICIYLAYIICVIIFILIFLICLYMSLVYLCVFSSGVYLYSRILMYVKHHEQFEIGCGSILKYSFIIIITFSPFNPFFSFRVAGLAISLPSFPVLSPFFHSFL